MLWNVVNLWCALGEILSVKQGSSFPRWQPLIGLACCTGPEIVGFLEEKVWRWGNNRFFSMWPSMSKTVTRNCLFWWLTPFTCRKKRMNCCEGFVVIPPLQLGGIYMSTISLDLRPPELQMREGHLEACSLGNGFLFLSLQWFSFPFFRKPFF